MDDGNDELLAEALDRYERDGRTVADIFTSTEEVTMEEVLRTLEWADELRVKDA